MFCPAGYGRVARAAHRAPPSDRLRVRPSRASRVGAPRCSPPPLRSGVAIDTPPRDARSGPARSGAIGLGPLGGLGHPPPRLAEVAAVASRLGRSLSLQQDLRVWAGGSSNPPVPRVAIGSSDRGSRTGEPRRGVDGRPSVTRREQRGAPARIALSGRGRRSMRARARGRPGPHPATRGTGKKEASTQWNKSPPPGRRRAGTGDSVRGRERAGGWMRCREGATPPQVVGARRPGTAEAELESNSPREQEPEDEGRCRLPRRTPGPPDRSPGARHRLAHRRPVADARGRRLRHRPRDRDVPVRHAAGGLALPRDRPRVARRGGRGRHRRDARQTRGPRGPDGAPTVRGSHVPRVPRGTPGLLHVRGVHRARHLRGARLHDGVRGRRRALHEPGPADAARRRGAHRASDHRREGDRPGLAGAAAPAVDRPAPTRRRAGARPAGRGARGGPGRAARRDGAGQRRLRDDGVLARLGAARQGGPRRGARRHLPRRRGPHPRPARGGGRQHRRRLRGDRRSRRLRSS